ncbi:hypothetical protein GCM10023080_045940 [Streptomyces pseudoechinosporeus]
MKVLAENLQACGAADSKGLPPEAEGAPLKVPETSCKICQLAVHHTVASADGQLPGLVIDGFPARLSRNSEGLAALGRGVRPAGGGKRFDQPGQDRP